MDRQKLIQQLELSRSLLNFFEGQYWGSDEVKGFYEDNRADLALQIRLGPLVDHLLASDKTGEDPWNDEFSYDLMEAYADRYDARTFGFDHAHTWEDIGKLLVLKELRAHPSYQENSSAKDGNKYGRQEWLKRRALFSHIRNTVPNDRDQKGTLKNPEIYRLLSKEVESDEKGNRLFGPNLPDLEELSNSFTEFEGTFSEAERFRFLQVQPFEEHGRLRKAGHRYASLEKAWDTVRDAFKNKGKPKERTKYELGANKLSRPPRQRIRGI